MQREAWTDERLDDLAARVDAGFERVDRDIRDLRGEMNSGFASLRSEIEALRSRTDRFGIAILAAIVVSALLHGF